MAIQKKLVVIGGGAAGFFCAINAAMLQPDLQVILVEKSNKVLSKVKISGGGRCNVTHHCFEIEALSKHYPRGQHFLKKAFHWFNATDTIQWFEQRGVTLKAEADGRMFPVTDSSQTIIDCLLKEADKYGVRVQLGMDIKRIDRIDNHFVMQDVNGKSLTADYLCIATGGQPKTTQYEWLTSMGHDIELPVPSLFTFNIPNNNITQLMGVSVDRATIKIQSSKLVESGPLLITHWGLSGPAILKLSAWGARYLADCNYHFTALVNWLPDYTENSLRDSWPELRRLNGAQKMYTKNPFGLPNRLWQYLLLQAGIDAEKRWADLPAKQQNTLIQYLTAHSFPVKGKTTFKEEFVTCGGIKLAQVDVNTMQSKIVPHLYFAGEILDIDGVTGGFNFQNAWTTGWIAANAIAAIKEEP
ncbi:BaiN/RdsA family NAD(P)/FAD-dependent oxidoreductase [Limnovirga soli]|uniref:Aminoacetone oxidase family FAD-binding enzyme n=1 Tax=Limnovirga soli TaxID=2656915 RepID=A0A8J8FFE8_9BACT|nr:NAD(P)/FAD-dependent oxidoreductase [Limnovirga soli]NNV56710.1 aminoacetone oxidase family FAD-binding enzyme [Limnovirga soli]